MEDIDASRFAVGHRPSVCPGASRPADVNAAGTPVWTTRTDTSRPMTALPYAPHGSGLAIGGEAELFETLECYIPSPAEGIALLSKLWEPKLTGGQAIAPTTRCVFHCPPSFPANSVDALESNLRITFVPGVQEFTEFSNAADVWDSSTTFKEEGSQWSSSRVKDLTEDRKQSAAILKSKLSRSSTYTGKTSATTPHKFSYSSRPGAAKKAEHATPYVDVSLLDSLSETEGLSCEDGVQIVSEKHRKRMLSNRASAQRSRQRRQERLDTLEVLVAELRVENVALTRKAITATLAVKKSDKENKILRDQLGRRGALPRSGPTNENDKSIMNSDMDNTIEEDARLCGASVDPARNGPPAADTDEPPHSDSPLPLKTIRDDDGADVENSRSWNSSNSSSGGFDFQFNSGPMEEGVEAEFCGGGEPLITAARVPEDVNGKGQYPFALAQQNPLQNLLGREFENYAQDMDKEDMWMGSLASFQITPADNSPIDSACDFKY